MAKTRSMTRSQNHDDASNRKRFKTLDNQWSDLTHDVLFLVMMQLGLVDFVGFSGVCKSWRFFANSNRNRFMASRPPMMMWIEYHPDKTECYLEDFEGRRFKSLFSRAADMRCTGLTCGYVVLFGEDTNTDVWLVNPITRHELHFPHRPIRVGYWNERVRSILVFSRFSSIFGWVLVMANRLSHKIWFSIAGSGAWNYVSSDFPILDLHAFKGKIYTLHYGQRLCEMTLDPADPKLTLLKIKDFSKPHYYSPKFVSADEHLYVVDCIPGDFYRVHRELDFGEMKWVLPEEKTIGEYSFFLSLLLDGAAVDGAAVELESRVPRSIYYDWFPHTPDKKQKGWFFTTKDHIWYFLHECMSVNHIHE